MDRTKIKNYAPEARRSFRDAVRGRLALFGIRHEKGALIVDELVRDGAGIVVGGRAYPRSLAARRDLLEHAVRRDGYEHTIERLAYTWFNRLVAIRYMELHGYLDHGYRVLSHPEGKPTPEILEHAEHVELPDLSPKRVIELKIDGNRDEELYRLLLVAQCNAMHAAMPFLFERVDDESELALPENLLHSDSVVRGLVLGVDEDDWQEVEVIGWLYEAYISERYQAVIGKVVASEDIPAATQRFTPKWIVRYLVQNTLGRTWLATYPGSPLRGQMKYYIEPAEQAPEVQAELRAITPASLDPEAITFLDPACGSGHILVEAYDLYRAIYQERGYRARDIPALILKKNLFGFEIDDRAAQLAAFALLMKARADDPGLLKGEVVQPNILAIQESKGLDAREITEALNQPVVVEDPPATGRLFEPEGTLFTRERMGVPGDVAEADVAQILALFENAKTFGSLIQVPEELAGKVEAIGTRTALVARRGDGFAVRHAANFHRIAQQAMFLARRFGCVVANPPYMSLKFFGTALKRFADENYKDAKGDLYGCFIKRCITLGTETSSIGLITIPNWMFLSSFRELRRFLCSTVSIQGLVHNGRGVFGSDFGSCSFVIRRGSLRQFSGTFFRLFDSAGSVSDNDELSNRFLDAKPFFATTGDFAALPGLVIAYWISRDMRQVFARIPKLGTVASPVVGILTGNDDRFLRLWFEVSFQRIGFDADTLLGAKDSRRRWFPFQKGGPCRKWYGNMEYIVNWYNDGAELKKYTLERCGSVSKRIYNTNYFFREGLTYGSVSIGLPSFRWMPKGQVISHVGQGIFSAAESPLSLLGFLNSTVAMNMLGVLSPTAHFESGQIRDIPYVGGLPDLERHAREAVSISKVDWDSRETSWNFGEFDIAGRRTSKVSNSLTELRQTRGSRAQRLREIEESINRIVIRAYELEEELSPDVPESDITLDRPDRPEDIRRLISYAIGCMMGRYSLDRPGLVYADAGGVGFDPAQYTRFRADDDGILALTETDWGLPDDAASRFEEFLGVAWPKEGLEENLAFVAESLEPKKGESSRACLRRYMATGFYKHHLQMYKRRPIYWLFSSGKMRAFQCLVYLHRYHPGTLARMRTEYVIPLMGRIAGRIQRLEEDRANPSSSAHLKDIQKKLDSLKKQEVELRGFDERLKHFADQRIALDLDDGVKVNYGKFGDLLAEVKAVTGGKDDE